MIAMPEQYRCYKCRTTKPISEFYPHCTRGHTAECKVCSKIMALSHAKTPKAKATRRAYYLNNSAKILKYWKEYRDKFPERCKESKRKYLPKQRLRRKLDANFRLSSNLRNRICCAIKGKHKQKKTMELLGCSLEDFKIYLESKFETGMTWENYGRGVDKWEVDHIMPCAIFDLTKPEHQKRCFHFSNLQPLWRKDNRTKSAKITTPQLNLL